MYSFNFYFCVVGSFVFLLLCCFFPDASKQLAGVMQLLKRRRDGAGMILLNLQVKGKDILCNLDFEHN